MYNVQYMKYSRNSYIYANKNMFNWSENKFQSLCLERKTMRHGVFIKSRGVLRGPDEHAHCRLCIT